MTGDFWKACDEADCGLAFLIEFFSHRVPAFELGELDRASFVGDLDEHPNNSFKSALSRRLPIMIESVTVQSAASWVRGRLETRWFQVHPNAFGSFGG